MSLGAGRRTVRSCRDTGEAEGEKAAVAISVFRSGRGTKCDMYVAGLVIAGTIAVLLGVAVFSLRWKLAKQQAEAARARRRRLVAFLTRRK